MPLAKTPRKSRNTGVRVDESASRGRKDSEEVGMGNGIGRGILG